MKKIANIATVSIFLLLIFGIALAFWIIPDKAFSDEENRSLRTFPAFSVDSLLSGAYSDAVNVYFADQFPLRDGFVGWKGMVEYLQGKGENNGILLGKNQQLARRLFDIRRGNGGVTNDMDLPDPKVLRAAVDAIERVDASLTVPFSVMLTPRPIDVAAEAFDYPAEISTGISNSFYGSLSESVSTVDLLPEFRQRYANGEYVYYRTDHHWTTLGAYYAYAALMREWGMEAEIIPIEAFDRQVVSNSFYGTLWSAGGMKWVAPDSVEFWRFYNEGEFSVIADGKSLNGFYNEDCLLKKDKYAAFLDGTHDVVTVTKNTSEPRPRLVLFKDSFANSLCPFLAQHFDLILLNLSSARTDFTNVSAYARQYSADRVLLLYTLENVITADRIGKLY